MSGNISLENSIRTCKVDTAWANKLESDRFLNPNNMVCPPWNGVDTAGRPSCEYSYNTKTAGCNSAGDRVNIENGLRPQYIEYVNLDAAGIRGGLDCNTSNNPTNPDTICHRNVIDATHQYTGQFGYNTGFSQNIAPNCLSCQNYPSQRAYGQGISYNNGKSVESFRRGRAFRR